MQHVRKERIKYSLLLKNARQLFHSHVFHKIIMNLNNNSIVPSDNQEAPNIQKEENIQEIIWKSLKRLIFNALFPPILIAATISIFSNSIVK